MFDELRRSDLIGFDRRISGVVFVPPVTGSVGPEFGISPASDTPAPMSAFAPFRSDLPPTCDISGRVVK